MYNFAKTQDGPAGKVKVRLERQFARFIFDRSLVEAVQGIALSGDFRVPFAQI